MNEARMTPRSSARTGSLKAALQGAVRQARRLRTQRRSAPRLVMRASMLEQGYRAMALDQAREACAQRWCEALGRELS